MARTVLLRRDRYKTCVTAAICLYVLLSYTLYKSVDMDTANQDTERSSDKASMQPTILLTLAGDKIKRGDAGNSIIQQVKNVFNLTNSANQLKQVLINPQKHLARHLGRGNHGPPRDSSRTNEKECQKMHFSETKLPVTALASWPGSGNTWMRHLIQQATGIYTGSIYKDNTLKRSGFLGEGIHDGTVICTKTHEWPGHEPKIQIKFERALLVVRRPEDALRSYFQNRHVGHTGSIHLSKANMEKKWREFVDDMMETWVQFHLHWLEFNGPLRVVSYEDVKANISQSLTDVMEFLSGQADPSTIECVRGNAVGNFKRKNSTDSLQVLKYTDSDDAMLQQSYQRVQTALQYRCSHMFVCSNEPV